MEGAFTGISGYLKGSNCQNNGCPQGVCPDITLKRHDTTPAFKLLVEDCNGPLDLTDESYVVEVSIWAKAKLKHGITAEDTYFQLADNIGFDQILTGDVIVMSRVRQPEYMLVTGFDEINRLVQVQRAYNGTVASEWKKGTAFRILRSSGAIGSIETVTGDVLQADGTPATDQILETYLVYEWAGKDTCTPGCYWLEFKLIKMEEDEDVGLLAVDESISNISFTSSDLTYSDYGCDLGAGVESIRRFPLAEGFLVYIIDSFTHD